MGLIDIETKKYMSDAAHFADAFNFLIHDGRPIIKPEDLKPVDSTEIVIPYGNDAREPKQKVRDVMKIWQAMRDENAIYVMLAAENQAKVHYAMPVKDGLYDFMHYAGQVEEAKKSYRKADSDVKMSSEEFLSGFRRGDKLMPVITLVLYFGASEWDGPMSIHEMLSVQDDTLLRFVPDYKINLIAPAQMAEDDFSKFQTELGQVLEYIKYSDDGEKLEKVVQEARFRALDRDSAELINLATGSNLTFNEKEEKIDMCMAIEQISKKSEENGVAIGENRLSTLLTQLFALGRTDDAKKAASDEVYRKKLYNEFQIV